MQANNKGDAMQVYEGATRATQKGIKGFIKGSLKYILKPFLIFSYRYFVEGIKVVQKNGVRVVATERRITDSCKQYDSPIPEIVNEAGGVAVKCKASANYLKAMKGEDALSIAQTSPKHQIKILKIA